MLVMLAQHPGENYTFHVDGHGRRLPSAAARQTIELCFMKHSPCESATSGGCFGGAPIAEGARLAILAWSRRWPAETGSA
jgi:hypothetical protein